MKNLKFQLTLVIVLTSTIVFGQIPDKKQDELPYIEVTGTAEMNIIPDEIFIGISIRERYENKKKITIEEQEALLISAIKSLGIDLKNLYLTDVNAGFVKIRYKKSDVLTKKDYTLKVSDAEMVGKIFQELDKLEISDADIIRVNHSQIENLRQEVKIQAIKAAKIKADYLLNAIGEQTGKPLIIRENEIQVYRPMMTSNTLINVNDLPESTNSEDVAVQFQKIKIQSSFYVKFSIK